MLVERRQQVNLTGDTDTVSSSETDHAGLPLTIDEYLRKKLMPVEGVIPHLPGIDMYGNTIPDEIVGGDVFEYINFQQRYNIEARIAQAQWLAQEVLEPLAPGAKA